MHEQYLTRTPDGFSLGPRVGALFECYQSQLEPDPVLIDLLHRLRAETGETVYITGWLNGALAIRYCLEGAGALRVRSASIGYSENPHARAAARAMLAFVPEQELGRYIPRGQFARLTPSTIVDPVQLVRRLRNIRRVGLSVEEEEFAIGVACLGSPVFNASGHPVAAFGMSVPISQYREAKQFLCDAIHTAGLTASNTLGFRDRYPDGSQTSIYSRK